MQKLLDAFNKKGFKAFYFEQPEHVLAFLQKEINGLSVGFGGSTTLDQLGVYDVLSPNNSIYWHWKDKKHDTIVKAILSDVFMCSANAITRNGEIINIDASGNRTSAIAYGPNRKKIFFVCGTNKITDNLEKGIERAKTVAAPLNAKRFFDNPTPKDVESICKVMSVMQYPTCCDAYVIILKGDYGF